MSNLPIDTSSGGFFVTSPPPPRIGRPGLADPPEPLIVGLISPTNNPPEQRPSARRRWPTGSTCRRLGASSWHRPRAPAAPARTPPVVEGVVHGMAGVLGGHEHGGDCGDVDLTRHRGLGLRGHVDDLLAEHRPPSPMLERLS